MYTGIGIQYTLLRTGFKDTDSSGVNYQSINTSQNIDFSGIVGYRLETFKKRISFLPIAALVFSRQGKSSGQMIDRYTYKVENVNNVLDYNLNQFSLGVGFKVLYKMTKATYLYVEPFYRVNLRSIVNKDYFYTIQRNFFGIRVGLLFDK
ncbi:MAG TPA: autotransporter outer membrane beta-barrel domain-containing protein [Cytophagaceae bacterium]|jgi:outer membrane autotransporter protein|nr:autotransporter outer membrane beta-barrel domain-containing protein [Cytophagaceae bacterium]